MARYDFGGTLADFVVTSRRLGGLDVLGLSAATLTFWSAQTGGTKYTDLQLNGSSVSSISVGSDGQVPKFQGPDGVTEMWADGGSARIRVVTLQGAPGPAGRDGTNGLPGVNGVANDTATASQISTPGTATDTALKAAYTQLTSVATTVTASATLAANRHTPVDATAAARTMTLPTSPAGTLLSVEKTDASANAVNVTGTLRGAASSTIALTAQYDARTFLSEGGGSWRPVSDHRTASSLAAQFAARRVFDVKTYGAIGDGVANDVAAINAAIAAAAAAGGGFVYFPRGDYRVTSSLLVTASKVWLCGDGEGASRIIQDGAMTTIISFSGTLAPLASPTAVLSADAGWDNADATIGQTCTVVNASGLTAGDIVVIGDNRATPTGATASANTTDNAGEMQRIKSVSGTTITFHGRLRDTYTVARSASIHKVTPLVGVGVSDLGVGNAKPLTTTAKMIDFFACQDVSVSRVVLRDGDNAALNLNYVYGADVDRIKVHDIADDSANSRFGYGVNIGPSDGVTITSSRFRRLRHAVTTNGGGTTGRGFAHDVIIANCTVSQSTSSGFDTHPGGEVTFIGCQSSQVNVGPAFSLRSQARLVDCTSSYCNIGVFIQGETASHSDIVNHSHHHSAGGGIVFWGDGVANWPLDTRIVAPAIRDTRADAIIINGPADGVLLSDARIQRAGNATTLQSAGVNISGGALNVNIVGLEVEAANSGVLIGTGTNQVRVAGTRTRALVGSTPAAVKGSGATAATITLHDNLDLDLDGSADRLMPALPAGAYIYTSSPGTNGTSNGLNVGSLRVVPWLVKRKTSIAQLLVDVSAASEAGGKIRMGVYKDDGTGYPGALVVDSGQVAADAVAVAAGTAVATLMPGLYWVGAVVQNVVTTQPTVRTISGSWTPPIPLNVGSSAPAANGVTIGIQQSGFTAALPATFPAGGGPSGFAARIIAKTA